MLQEQIALSHHITGFKCTQTHTRTYNLLCLLLCLTTHRSLLTSWISPSLLSTMQRLSQDTPLPRGVDAIFSTALRSCNTAAVDELMGLTSQAVQRYAKVCAVLCCLLCCVCMCELVNARPCFHLAHYIMLSHAHRPSTSYCSCSWTSHPLELRSRA